MKSKLSPCSFKPSMLTALPVSVQSTFVSAFKGTVDVNSLRRVGHHWRVKFRFNIIFPSTAKLRECRRRQEAMIALQV